MKNYLEGHLQLDEVHLTPNFDVLDIVAKYCFGWFMKVLKWLFDNKLKPKNPPNFPNLRIRRDSWSLPFVLNV